MGSEDDRVTVLGRTTIDRIDALIGELDGLNAAWKRRITASTRLERRELADPLPGLHDFLTSVKGTKNSVQRILKARAGPQPEVDDGDDAISREERDNKDIAVIMGCGLNSHQEQWDAIKRAHGLLALRRRFSGKASELGQTIDAVVENGTEWIKVSIVTEKKLIYQMAQEGWHPDDSEEDSDSSDDEDTGIGIVKVTTQLVKAARLNRCNTRIPRIRLVLPNLTEGRVKAIDKQRTLCDEHVYNLQGMLRDIQPSIPTCEELCGSKTRSERQGVVRTERHNGDLQHSRSSAAV